jgi:dTDP-4-dehydrorhamnose 3,5-epimerase
MAFEFQTTKIPGVVIIQPKVFGDSRGYFMETYNYNDFKEAGIDHKFVQDNQSASKKGVLRGLHFQINFPQDKLVRVVSGAVLDVAIDLRKGSQTYGRHFSVVLTGENKKQVLIPRGFAHGFIVLEDDTIFAYKCDNVYDKFAERGMRFDDPALGIEWPDIGVPLVLSEKDRNPPLFCDVPHE